MKLFEGKKGAVAVERQKFVMMLLVYLDEHPLMLIEGTDGADAARAVVVNGLDFGAPDDADRVRVVPAHAAPIGDLEKVKVLMNLKGALFNLAQLAEAIRMGRSGLVHPGTAGRPS